MIRDEEVASFARIMQNCGVCPIIAPVTREIIAPIMVKKYDWGAIGYLTTKLGGAIMGKTQTVILLTEDINLFSHILNITSKSLENSRH